MNDLSTRGERAMPRRLRSEVQQSGARKRMAYPRIQDGTEPSTGLSPPGQERRRSVLSAPQAPLPPRSLVAEAPIPLNELLRFASEFSEAGRSSEAERMLDHILSIVPDEPLALHEKGILLFRMKRHQAAAETIERAVSLAPDATAFSRNLCPIYERIGRYDDALRVGHETLDRADRKSVV